MYKIIFAIAFFTSVGFSAQAQHFDPLFSENSTRTWRDSGYYFMPHLIRFQITSLDNNSGIYSINVNFLSTDMSSLMFTGQATIFFSEGDLPSGVDIEVGTRGFATVLFPQDLLFCPSPEEEQGMGQDDPYLPITLAGRIEKIAQVVLDDPIQSTVQLNDFTVN
jgi:hypothetical protein